MRKWAWLVGFAAVQMAQAQGTGFLGTKADAAKKVAGDPSTPSIMPLLQMLLVAGILLYLFKSLAPKLISKFNKRLVTNNSGNIFIEESAQFAGGSLFVVTARQRTLLLSVGSNGVNCLADLTATAVQPDPPLFMEMVDGALSDRGTNDEPPRAAVYLEEPDEVEEEPVLAATSPAKSEIESALERLKRFDS